MTVLVRAILGLTVYLWIQMDGGGQVRATQAPRGTQHAQRAQQTPGSAGHSGQADAGADSDDEPSSSPQWMRPVAPVFEAFWQGRLIPGGC